VAVCEVAGVVGADSCADAIGWSKFTDDVEGQRTSNSNSKGKSEMQGFFAALRMTTERRYRGERRTRLGEDDGFVGVGEDAVGEVPAYGSGENEAFEVAALLDEVG